jgi:hypothetical protein
MPGRNVTGRQPYFPDVPGLTVALLRELPLGLRAPVRSDSLP